jgi:hypothetical protein
MRAKSPETAQSALIKEVEYKNILIKKKGNHTPLSKEATPEPPTTMLSEPNEVLIQKR